MVGARERGGVGAGGGKGINVGKALGEIQRAQAHVGAGVEEVVPELWGVPAMRHEGACASASLAVLAAMAEIEAGRYDCVLVLGAEANENLPGDPSSATPNPTVRHGPQGTASPHHAAPRFAPQGQGRRYISGPTRAAPSARCAGRGCPHRRWRCFPTATIRGGPAPLIGRPNAASPRPPRPAPGSPPPLSPLPPPAPRRRCPHRLRRIQR